MDSVIHAVNCIFSFFSTNLCRSLLGIFFCHKDNAQDPKLFDMEDKTKLSNLLKSSFCLKTV